MPTSSIAGHLAGGPISALLAAANDIYLEAATGNLIVRLQSGTALTITPGGGLILPAGGLVVGGVDLAAAITALQASDASQSSAITALQSSTSTLQTQVTALQGASAATNAALASLSQNLVVNGGFEVLQRTAPFSANLAYAHDRWQILLGGTSTVSVTDETALVDTGSGHALRAAYVQGSAVSLIDQKLEHFAQLRGRTVTFAVRVRKGVASSVRPYIDDSGAKTYGTPTATTGAYETLSVTLAIGSAATAVRVGVELSATDTVYLDNATLAIGSAVMVYPPLPLADDVARCKRYYWEVGGTDANEVITVMEAYSTTAALGDVRYPVEMAIVPTVTVSAPGDFALLSAAGSNLSCTALVGATITRTHSRLSATVGSGLVGGNATALAANVTLAARLRFEANP